MYWYYRTMSDVVIQINVEPCQNFILPVVRHRTTYLVRSHPLQHVCMYIGTYSLRYIYLFCRVKLWMLNITTLKKWWFRVLCLRKIIHFLESLWLSSRVMRK
jgi:hypothetical protein